MAKMSWRMRRMRLAKLILREAFAELSRMPAMLTSICCGCLEEDVETAGRSNSSHVFVGQ